MLLFSVLDKEMFGCGSSSRSGYPLHAFHSPQFIPDTSFLNECCSCHRNIPPVTGIYLPMNEILFMLCCAFYKVFSLKRFIFCRKNARVLSQEILLVPRTAVLFQEFVSLSAKPTFGEQKCLPVI